MGMTQVALAKHLGWTWARLNEIVNGHRGISASSALAFGQAFGTGPEFWLNLQRDWDLWHAQKKHRPVTALKKAS
jgi:antitoxin HigA-1